MTLFKKIAPFSLLIIFLWTVASSGKSIEQETLFVHNQLRTTHHVPPLEWDSTLAHYAEHYASQCRFKHSGSPYGENLAAGYPSVSAAIHAWDAEKKNYSYIWPGFSYKTGHFTQVVWKSTEKLGCAFVLCNDDKGRPWHYLVCEYSPHGNITNMGYFRENVLPE